MNNSSNGNETINNNAKPFRVRFRTPLWLITALITVILVCIAVFGESKRKESINTYGCDASHPISKDVYLLDTFCTLTIYAGGDDETLKEGADIIAHYDKLFNFGDRESDIYKINNRVEKSVHIDPETVELLNLSKEFEVITDGAFCPAIKPLTSLWDFKKEKKIPNDKLIAEALNEVEKSEWHIENDEFIADNPATKIDVGAVAKGFIADKLKDFLLSKGVNSAIINLGGNVLCVGTHPDGTPFKIGIKDPDNEGTPGAELSVTDKSVVTAGIYERCFEENGHIYHHILDPATGYPVDNNLESVTVIGSSSAICDILSTTIMVKGEDKGRALLAKYNEENAADYDVYFLYRD